MKDRAEFTNGLDAARAERLALLVEEAAEVQQIACKILRHGYESAGGSPGYERTNRMLLEAEIADFEYAKSLLVCSGDIDPSRIARRRVEAERRKPRYLHHQEGLEGWGTSPIGEPETRFACHISPKVAAYGTCLPSAAIETSPIGEINELTEQGGIERWK